MTAYSLKTGIRLHLHDLLELTKPRVLLLMWLTIIAGMVLAPIAPDAGQLIFASTGIILLAASGAVMNHLLEAESDQNMRRTARRPLAGGRLSRWEAAVWAASLAIIGSVLVLQFSNGLTLWLTYAATIGYGLIYTAWLKRASPQNIVIAGLSGALPPLLGWVAVTGYVEPMPLLLVAIIYTWTPPHFWALALARKEDYAKAKLPMLPVTHGNDYTCKQIVLYSLLMISTTYLPWVMQYSGLIYVVIVSLANLRFLQLALRVDNQQPQPAMQLFWFSIKYLAYLYIALIVDHLLI